MRDFKEDSEVLRQTISDSTERWLKDKMGQTPENESKITLPLVPIIYTN